MHGRPRLTIPQLRTAPEDVVRACREISPTAELVYMGDGRWLLGEVERTNARETAGRYKMQVARSQKVPHTKDPLKMARFLARWRWVAYEGELLAQGFAAIKLFELRDPDSTVVEYLRERHYAWRRDLDAALRRVMHALPDDEQNAREIQANHDAAITPLLDEARLREAYRFAFKKRQHFLAS